MRDRNRHQELRHARYARSYGVFAMVAINRGFDVAMVRHAAKDAAHEAKLAIRARNAADKQTDEAR